MKKVYVSETKDPIWSGRSVVRWKDRVKEYNAPSNIAGYNFVTETNLHLRKPRYSKMVI